MKRVGLFSIGILLIVVIWNFSRQKKSKVFDDTGGGPEGVVATGGVGEDRNVRLIKGSFLITDYGKEEGSLKSDLEALRDVVGHCQTLFKDFDRYHLPGNPEIMRFLQGRNPDRLAWIPSEYSFLNDQGELLDRHGMPVFFHRLSGTRFEYRSAGPDRRMWSDDDVIVK